MADAARQSTVLKGDLFCPGEKFWGFAQQETDDSISFVWLREWEAHNCSLELPGLATASSSKFKPHFSLAQEIEMVELASKSAGSQPIFPE